MRLPLLFTAVLALPIGAQGFEGTVAMKITAPEGAIDMKYSIKGDRMAMQMAMPASAGPMMAGVEVRMLVDGPAKTMTMYVPAPATMSSFLPPDTKGIKMVTPIPEESGGAAEGSGSLKKLGTSQTIAGMKCDDYEVSGEGGTAKMCLASGLGAFAYPNLGGGMMGGRGGRGGRGGAAAPGWSKGLGQAPGFPLKVWDEKGNPVMEVTSLQKGPVSDEIFTAPTGYVDLQAMMGGRGG